VSAVDLLNELGQGAAVLAQLKGKVAKLNKVHGPPSFLARAFPKIVLYGVGSYIAYRLVADGAVRSLFFALARCLPTDCCLFGWFRLESESTSATTKL